MSPKIRGTLIVTDLQGQGELRLGPNPRLSLTGICGQGRLQAGLEAGPLRLPLRLTFGLHGEGPELVLQPRRGGALLRALAPLFNLHRTTESTWSLRDGALRLDLAKATAGRVRLAASSGLPLTANLLPLSLEE